MIVQEKMTDGRVPPSSHASSGTDTEEFNSSADDTESYINPTKECEPRRVITELTDKFTTERSKIIRTIGSNLLAKLSKRPDEEKSEEILETVSLTNQVVENNLSELRRSMVSGKYTYSRLNLANQQLSDIHVVSNYIHLRFVDLSRNFISNLKPLAALDFLEVLDASENCIENVEDIPVSKYLKHLYLRKNYLTRLTGFPPNSISHLDLRENKLSTVEGLTEDIFPQLNVLELRDNCVTSLKGISLPNLQKFFAPENKISSIGGLSNCPKLKILHLRANKIFRLRDFPDLACLEYVNFRENNIRRFTETTYLMHAPNIRVLILTSNPICHSYRYRIEMAVAVPLLQRLDKTFIEMTELDEGRRIFCGRMKGKIPPIMDDPVVLTPPGTPGCALTPRRGSVSQNESESEQRNIHGDDDDDRLVPPNTPTPPSSFVEQKAICEDEETLTNDLEKDQGSLPTTATTTYNSDGGAGGDGCELLKSFDVIP